MGYPVEYTNTAGFELPEEGRRASTFTSALFRIGVSGTPAHIKTTTIPLAEIHATCALLTGTQTAMAINFAQTGIGAVVEAFQVKTTVSAKAGGWVNSIFAQMDFTSTGYVAGAACAISAELSLPGSATWTSGEYACIACELDSPASSSGCSNNKTAFMAFNAWGDTVAANFRRYGYLFNIQGVGAADTNYIFSPSNNAADHALRIVIDNVNYWILLANASD